MPRGKKASTPPTTATTPVAPKKNALQMGRAMLKKVFPEDSGGGVTLDENAALRSLPHIPTGSFVIDYAIGGRPNKYGVSPCPGLPKGRLINVYGTEGSGKTTFCLMTSAQVCAAGGQVVYIDWEYAIVPSYAQALGIPSDDNLFYLVQPKTLEQGLSDLYVMAKAGVDLIVLDSVGAGVPKAIMEQALDEKGETGRIGLQAKLWSKILAEMKGTCARTGTTIIGISQLRKVINKSGYGPDSLPQGGESWKFNSDLMIRFTKIGMEKGKMYDALTHKTIDTAVANKIRLRLDKCRISASQGREADFFITYGEGIDDLRSLIEIGSLHGVVKKGGPWYSWERQDGSSIRAQGTQPFKDLIKAAAGAREELLAAVRGKLLTAADSDTKLTSDEDEIDLADVEAFVSGLDTPVVAANPSETEPTPEG